MANKARKLAYNPLDMLLSDAQRGADEQVTQLDPTAIVPNPHQPRQFIDPEEQAEIEASVRQGGVHQPLVVRPVGADSYELVAGSRRLAAAIAVGLATVPVVVRHYSDEEAEQVALIENLQRANLRFDDEAHALLRLKQRFNLTNEVLARSIGKSTDYVELRIAAAEHPRVLQMYMNGFIDQRQIRTTVREIKLYDTPEQADQPEDNSTYSDPNGSDREVDTFVQQDRVSVSGNNAGATQPKRTRKPPDGWRWAGDAERRLWQLPERAARMDERERAQARERLLRLREAADRALETLG